MVRFSFMGALLTCLIGVESGSAVLAQDDVRAIDQSLVGMMRSATAELIRNLDASPATRKRNVSVGKFAGPLLPDASFDSEFERLLKELLGERFDDNSTLVVSGEYRPIGGQDPGNQGLTVIQITLVTQEKFVDVIPKVTREINRTADILKITGATLAIPDVKDVKVRNKKATEAITEPSFQLRRGLAVAPVGHDAHAVMILKRVGGKGAPQPVKPRNVKGTAFVDLRVDDTFQIELLNFDTESDAVALVTIDGLDVANAFSEDPLKYDGWVLARAKPSGPPTRGRLDGWLRTTSTNRGNVLEFVIKDLGKGAATAMKSRNRLGVIHVEFYEAAPKGSPLRPRSVGGEAGLGRPLDRDLEVKQVVRRDTPIASISIRYANR